MKKNRCSIRQGDKEEREAQKESTEIGGETRWKEKMMKETGD
jgi:hypothetical protein